ncbi:MAG TPA: hypothetical protein VMV10_27825 [Pirellulales bacterium]|nr:hypothetical protein [Pirellulales bacterium]
MSIVYIVCAALGGTVLVFQFAMALIGLEHGDMPDDLPHDIGHDFAHDVQSHDGDAAHDGETAHDAHHSSSFLSILTFRTVVAALTFFGLAGMGGGSANLPLPLTLAMAVAAGLSAMYIIHWLMQSLHRLKADGTARIERSVGKSGTVYLRIPAHKGGVGKIQINLQNRTMEYEAMTSQNDLPVGAKVVVVGVIGPDTVEVELVPEPQRSAHV